MKAFAWIEVLFLMAVVGVIGAGLCLVGCSKPLVPDPPSSDVLNEPIKEIQYQGCQYLVVESGDRLGNNYAFSFTHKGNCTNH